MEMREESRPFTIEKFSNLRRTQVTGFVPRRPWQRANYSKYIADANKCNLISNHEKVQKTCSMTMTTVTS